jgi:hypothetical protein
MVTYTLTESVTGGGGTHGTITNDPLHDDSYDDGTYDVGTTVILTVTPATGNVFDHWAGADAASITGSGTLIDPYQIIMIKDMVIQAVFVYIEYTLTINGDVRLASTSNNPSQSTYHYGASVIVTVTSLSTDNAQFVKWQDANTDNPRTIIISATPANNVYTVTFKWRKIYVQTFGSAGSGSTGSKIYKECFGTSKPALVDPTDVKTWGGSGKGYNETYGELA